MSGDMKPLNGNLFPPHITSGKKRNPLFKDAKVADLAAADLRRMELYRIYGRQEPGPLDEPVVRTRRGRA